MRHFLAALPVIGFASLVGLSLWLAEDYSNQRKAFQTHCLGLGGIPMTPEPGGGSWVCLKRDEVLE